MGDVYQRGYSILDSSEKNLDVSEVTQNQFKNVRTIDSIVSSFGGLLLLGMWRKNGDEENLQSGTEIFNRHQIYEGTPQFLRDEPLSVLVILIGLLSF